MVGAAVLFAVLLALLRSPSESTAAPRSWHVLRKDTKLVALCALDESRSTWSGFFFAVLFYYALPLWWWQWGPRKALMLIMLPVAGAVLLSKFAVSPLLSAPGAPLDIGEGMLVTAVTLIPLRVLAGFHVRKHHRRFRRATLASRGWILAATVTASSASAATASFAGPSKFRRLVSSAKKVFNKRRNAKRSEA